MLAMVLVTSLAAALPQQQDFQTDTTVAVPAGARLRLDNVGGEVTIRTWDRNQVRIQASHSSRVGVGVNLTGSVLRLEPRSTRGFGGFGSMVDYTLTVPAAMGIEISGMFADVTIEGTRGDVKVNTVEGNITVRGGGDRLSLVTVKGVIVVQGARGRVEARSVSEDIQIADVQGEVIAEAVSGDIRLSRIDGGLVEASTVSGDVTFDGALRNAGTYVLASHSGDITVAVPENASATIRTSIASGDVSASFSLPASDRTSRRRQVFRLGSGSATVELETFSGDIQLVRPGELRVRGDRSN